MHRGRTYPYAVDYWVTEGWFWPGFLPWRMHLYVEFPVTDPWDIAAPGTELISDPIEYSLDRKTATYVWNLGGSPVNKLTAELALVMAGPGGLVVWEFQLTSGITLVATGMELQPYPQRQVYSTNGVQLFPICFSGGSRCRMWLTFRPATYAEGGSPWAT
jgi:hypothetical protein